MNIEELDYELYKAAYGKPRVGNYDEIWSRIKSNPEILNEGIKVKKDKFNGKDIVKGLTIADAILENFEEVDEVTYNNLINLVYTNKDIARIVLKGTVSGGFSFLIQSLWNYEFKLTEEQKKFAVDEAMNKISTVKSNKEKDAQVHGLGPFDIRYHILRNPNWTLEEKQKLIMDFWYDDEIYSEYLEQWEWSIVNDPLNFKDNPASHLEKIYIYDYKYESLLKFYGDKEITDKIWEEIEFCKQMRSLRAPKYEENYQKVKK